MFTKKSATAILIACGIICLMLGAGYQQAAAATIRATASPMQAAQATQQPAGTPAFAAEVAAAAPAEPYGAANTITFSNGYTIDTRIGEPELPAGLKYETPKGDEYTYYIVQFRGPIQPAWRQSLEDAGGQVMCYLPNYAFLVRMNETIRAKLTATKGEISWTGLYQPAYKISDRIASRAKGGTVRATVLLFTPESAADNVAQIEAIVGHKIFYKLETQWAPGQWNRKIFVDVTQKDLNA
ncbi:MAG TPA: hypothetical protein VMF29_03455, partial [Candidatus Edwardsbacteria bacterium]|nr:hypothetical protein [Candidatus Edwardsbacteria bacterium]